MKTDRFFVKRVEWLSIFFGVVLGVMLTVLAVPFGLRLASRLTGREILLQVGGDGDPCTLPLRGAFP